MLFLPSSVTGQAGIVVLLPVPFLYSAQAIALQSLLSNQGIGDIAADPDAWAVLQQYVNLHPRGDMPEAWGFALPEGYWCLNGLLLQLEKLNAVESLPERKRQTKLTADKIPPKSSGDRQADLIADLAQLYGVDGAFALLRKSSADQVNKIIFRTNENNRPQEERTKEVMEDAHERWIQENSDLFNSSLGLAL